MVECTISMHELANCHPKMLEVFVLSKLRDAGVPVKGILVWKGIKHGKLTWWDDPMADKRHFRWQDDVTEAGQSYRNPE